MKTRQRKRRKNEPRLLPPWQTARFVQHENVRLLRQRSRNQHPLLFAAGKRGKVLSGNALHAHKAQDIAGNLFILRGIVLAEFAAGRAAHQHHFQNGIVKVHAVFLPHHRHLPGRLTVGKGLDLPDIDEYGILLRGQGAIDVLEQHDLAAAVGADELFLSTCRDTSSIKWMLCLLINKKI